MEKISAVYKIVNTITGEFYIGSSKNVMKRWIDHKCPSKWKKYPNRPLYQDMQKYGVDKFNFEILKQVEPEYLKQVEQEFIDMLKPTYNNNKVIGKDIEKKRKADRKYNKSEKHKECQREYNKSEKGKEVSRKAHKKYYNQLCFYNGKILKLGSLSKRFYNIGIEHPVIEARKYLIKN